MSTYDKSYEAIRAQGIREQTQQAIARRRRLIQVITAHLAENYTLRELETIQTIVIRGQDPTKVLTDHKN